METATSERNTWTDAAAVEVTSSAADDLDEYFTRLNITLVQSISPILLIIGSVGNILSFIVLQTKSFRGTPSGFLLSALAMVDLGALYSAQISLWVQALTGLNLRTLSEAGCKADVIATYMFAQLSSWTLILITIERLVSVCYPLKAKILVTRNRVVVAWVVIAMVLIAFDAHFVASIGVQTMVDFDGATMIFCGYHVKYQNFGFLIWPWLDLSLMSLAPLLIIIVSNGVIVGKLCLNRKKRQDQMQVRQSDDTNTITIMLVAVSALFVITTIPLNSMALYYGLRKQVPDARGVVIYTSMNFLYNLNNCSNFYVYCLTGAKFRSAFRSIVCCRHEVHGRSSATQQQVGHSAPAKVSSNDLNHI